MHVSRLPTDDGKLLYRVDDDHSLQRMFFVVVDTEARELAITSIDLLGIPDQSDMQLLAARVAEPPTEERTNEIEWQYVSDGELATILGQLLGPDCGPICKDVGIATPDAAALDLPDPREPETPDAVKVGRYGFEFDPEVGGAPAPDSADPDGNDAPEDQGGGAPGGAGVPDFGGPTGNEFDDFVPGDTEPGEGDEDEEEEPAPDDEDDEPSPEER